MRVPNSSFLKAGLTALALTAGALGIAGCSKDDAQTRVSTPIREEAPVKVASPLYPILNSVPSIYSVQTFYSDDIPLRQDIWWQNETVITFLDSTGNRYILKHSVARVHEWVGNSINDFIDSSYVLITPQGKTVDDKNLTPIDRRNLRRIFSSANEATDKRYSSSSDPKEREMARESDYNLYGEDAYTAFKNRDSAKGLLAR